MDINKAYSVDNGVIIDEENGGPFYTGGTASPVGLDLPTQTFYVQPTAGGPILWRKFGVGVNDWRQLSAQDIPFDPSGYLNFEAGDTDVDLALKRFGGFSVSDLTEAEGHTREEQESTTSNGWVSMTTFPFLTTLSKTAGKFSIRWSANVGQSKTNRNFGFRARWRPEAGTWVVLSEIETSVNRDGDLIMQGGFKEVTLASNAKIEVDLQFGQTTQGNNALIENGSMELRRLGD